jgi:hypothetical protein
VRTTALLLSLALAGSLLASHVAGAGGDDRAAGSAVPADSGSSAVRGQRDLSLKSCGERFAHFHVGSVFEGNALTAHVRRCTAPEPERTVAAGGAIDPDSLGRSNFESWVYGTCQATAGQGCAPPLEIQSWPACERSPADYNAGPPGAAQPIQPRETLQIRGVPARLYDDGSLELSSGDVTVVIFGHDRRQLIAAARALRTPAKTTITVGVQEELPPPVPGAQDGTLGC